MCVLTDFRRYEGEKAPWWGRAWRYDYAKGYVYILPMPFCWVAQLAWKSMDLDAQIPSISL